jgi:hypothetical protein
MKKEITCTTCAHPYKTELDNPYPLCAHCEEEISAAQYKDWAILFLSPEERTAANLGY